MGIENSGVPNMFCEALVTSAAPRLSGSEALPCLPRAIRSRCRTLRMTLAVSGGQTNGRRIRLAARNSPRRAAVATGKNQGVVEEVVKSNDGFDATRLIVGIECLVGVSDYETFFTASVESAGIIKAVRHPLGLQLHSFAQTKRTRHQYRTRLYRPVLNQK